MSCKLRPRIASLFSFPAKMEPWSRSNASNSAHAAVDARCSAKAFSQPHFGPDYHNSVVRVLSVDRARWELVVVVLYAITTLPPSSKCLYVLAKGSTLAQFSKLPRHTAGKQSTIPPSTTANSNLAWFICLHMGVALTGVARLRGQILDFRGLGRPGPPRPRKSRIFTP